MSLRRAFRGRTAFTVLLLAATCAFAQQVVSDSAKPAPATSPANAKAVPDPHFQNRTPRYKLAPGDTFDLNFDLSPEFNQTAVSVQPDGFVTLRGVGDIKV